MSRRFFERRCTAGETGPDFQVGVFREVFEQLEVEWDGVEKDGEPYPATPENLAALPVTFLAEVLGKIRENTTPAESEGKA